MTIARLLHRDDRGASAVEMALIVPLLLVFVFGIFQMGVVLQANAGMQHALGEGARAATICINPSPTGCSSPADDVIIARMRSAVFGMKVGVFDDPKVTTPDPTDCAHCRDLEVNYRYSPNFLFFTGPQFNFKRTKRVYLAY